MKHFSIFSALIFAFGILSCNPNKQILRSQKKQNQSGNITTQSDSHSTISSADPDSPKVPQVMSNERLSKIEVDMLNYLQDGTSVTELLELAKKRRDTLRSFWETGKKIPGSSLMSAEKRAKFPKSVQRYIEYKATKDGVVRAVLPEEEREQEADVKLDYVLEGADVHLILGETEQRLTKLVGHQVKTTAWFVDGIMAFEDITTLQKQALNNLGVKRVLAVSVYFGDHDKSHSEQDIREGLVESDNSGAVFFDDVTRGRLKIELEKVMGPYSIEDTHSCEYYSWSIEVNDLLRGEGVEPSDYDHRVYFFPFSQSSQCTWGGLATLGGQSIWMRTTSSSTMSHELGHNYGMLHAGTIDCKNMEPLPIAYYNECYLNPTADENDVMGYKEYRRPNAAHQAESGWLMSHELITLEKSGVYNLEALHGSGTGPRVLRIPYSTFNTSIYVGYRQLLPPFDDRLRGGGIGAEVIIHDHVPDFYHGDTYRVRQPNGRSYLSDGEQFFDLKSGISIHQVSHDENSVTLDVSIIPITKYTLLEGSEQVEALATGTLSSGDEAALAVFHKSTGKKPPGDDFPRYREVGSQHTQLMTQILKRPSQEKKFTVTNTKPLSSPPDPTGYSTRVEHHAAAIFDSALQKFIVISTRKYDTQIPAIGSVRQVVLIHQVDPNSGDVERVGDIDLGLFQVPCGSTECQNPYWMQDMEIALVKGKAGYVLALGDGSDVLNSPGNHIILGRFELTPGSTIDSKEALNLRIVPNTEKSKWPTLVNENETLIIGWTRLEGRSGNRVEVYGYDDQSDQLFVPGKAPVAFSVGQSLPPLLLSGLGDEGSYDAWKADTAYLPSIQSFYTAFTYRGEAYNWEIVGRPFSIKGDAGSGIGDHTLLSPLVANWTHTSQIEAFAPTNGFALAFQEDQKDFFDGNQQIRIGFFNDKVKSLGQALITPHETELSPMILKAIKGSDSVLLLGSSKKDIYVYDIRWGH